MGQYTRSCPLGLKQPCMNMSVTLPPIEDEQDDVSIPATYIEPDQDILDKSVVFDQAIISEPAEVENQGQDTNPSISKSLYQDNPIELTEENETKSTTSSKKSQVSPISEDTQPYPASDSIPTSSSTLRLRSPVVSDTEEEQLDNAIEVDTSEEAKPVTLTEVESGSVKGSEDWEVTGEPIELFELEEAEQAKNEEMDSKKTVQCVGLFFGHFDRVQHW